MGLQGSKPASESKTIKAARKVKWISIIGGIISTALTIGAAYIPQIEAALSALPEPWGVVAQGAFGLLMFVLTYFYGEKSEQGRREATQKIEVVEK